MKLSLVAKFVMLPFCGLIYAVLTLQLVAGLALISPTKRSDHHLVNGWTPKPTHGPHVEIRADGIEKRQDTGADTCGYYVASTDLLFACPTRSQCAYSSNWMGCCQFFTASSTSSCFLHSSCFDSTAARRCTGDCADSALNLICSTSSLPYCYTNYVYGSNAEDTTTYTYFDCRSSQATSIVYPMDKSLSGSPPSASVTPTSTATPPPPSTSILPPPSSSRSTSPPATPPTTSESVASSSPPTPSSSSVPPQFSQSSPLASSFPPSTISATATGSKTTASSFSASPAGSSSSSRSSSSSSSNTVSYSPEDQNDSGGGGSHADAIAGGVVGGVVGVALIAGLVVMLVLRKRKQREEAEKNVREISAQ